MSILWNFDILVFLGMTTATRHDATALKQLILVSPPPGDEILREDLPSLRPCQDIPSL